MSKKSIGFHIKSNDYFGTLATVLSMVGQNIESCQYEHSNSTNIKILKKLEKDLMFLQNNYKIVKKM